MNSKLDEQMYQDMVCGEDIMRLISQKTRDSWTFKSIIYLEMEEKFWEMDFDADKMLEELYV